MEAVVAVLRPKHGSVILSKELSLTSFDILLVEMRALSAFLYRFTGGENGGIKGM